MFGCEEHDQGLPPFYLTLILPLQEVTDDLGPTQFILGSHTQPWAAALQKEKEGLDHLLATSKRGDCLMFDGRMIHRGTPCHSAMPRRAVYVVFHKKWYSDYVDNQFPAGASAHGVPRDGGLPSGFQVPLDVSQPDGEDPVWIFSAPVHIDRDDVIWRVGQGDSLVFDSKELFEMHQRKLSCLEAKEMKEKAYQTQTGKIVVRRDLSSLMPEDDDDALANVTVDDEGNWIASQDIAKDSTIILRLKCFNK